MWESPDQFEKDEYQHPPFSPAVRKLLATILETFKDIYILPVSLDEFEDGFRRDVHAEREIATWLHMAKVYRQFTDGRDLTMRKKLDIFAVVFVCANNGKENVFRTVPAPTLSRKRMTEIVNAFFASSSDTGPSAQGDVG
jgi:hypothetical protein